MPKIFVVALPILLAACNSTGGGQPSAAADFDPVVIEKVRQLRIAGNQYCKEGGYQPGTQHFEDCVYNYGREKIAEAEMSLATAPTYSAPAVIDSPSPAPRPPVICRTMPTMPLSVTYTYCN